MNEQNQYKNHRVRITKVKGGAYSSDHVEFPDIDSAMRFIQSEFLRVAGESVDEIYKCSFSKGGFDISFGNQFKIEREVLYMLQSMETKWVDCVWTG